MLSDISQPLLVQTIYLAVKDAIKECFAEVEAMARPVSVSDANANLIVKLETLADAAEDSLDRRPRFRRAISEARSAISQARNQ